MSKPRHSGGIFSQIAAALIVKGGVGEHEPREGVKVIHRLQAAATLSVIALPQVPNPMELFDGLPRLSAECQMKRGQSIHCGARSAFPVELHTQPPVGLLPDEVGIVFDDVPQPRQRGHLDHFVGCSVEIQVHDMGVT